MSTRQLVSGRPAAAAPPSFTPVRSGLLQRKSRHSSLDTLNDSSVPPIVHEVLRSPGEPLDAHMRAFMEPRFGHDFSNVRVHRDARAAESARAVNALAFTAGRYIVFGSGQFATGTATGRRLLAHELVHVVQQGELGSAGQPKLTLGTLEDAREHEADRFADSVTRGVVSGVQPHHPESKADHSSLAHPLPEVNPDTPVRHRGGPALQRQPATTSPTTQPASAPAGPQPWAACAADKVSQLNAELADAIAWVNQAIGDLQAADRPARTNGALGRYLSTDPTHVSGTILPTLQTILVELNRGAANFRCQTQQQCLAAFPGGAVAYSGRPITLCPGYFRKDSLGRPTTLIHEAGHNAGLAGNVIEWQWPFPGLSVSARLGNTESYAAFVRSNRYPQLAPFQQTGGAQLGIGALFPGGGIAPRFLVKAEFDMVLSQRIVRFFDVRLGLRFDVDSSGTVLGSATQGTRVFAPVSVSQTPLFLDLRTGVVVGRAADVGPRFEKINPFTDINVLGPSGEARVGILRGNFGGSIGYRHIWNMVKNNPNLEDLTISGEIRF